MPENESVGDILGWIKSKAGLIHNFGDNYAFFGTV